MNSRLVSKIASILGIGLLALQVGAGAYAQDHFNPKGDAASAHTSELQAALRDSLPF